MSTKTAIIHARVSDKKQAEKNLSIPGQIEAGKKRAEELGAEVLQVFVEGKARSAWRGTRPELTEAIDFCELHEVNYFITWDTARFSRDTATGPMNRLRLRAAGTFIEYITVKIDPDTEEGFILENIYQLTDELKSRKTSTDTRRSMIKNAEAGFWNGGLPPFGYRVVSEGKRKRLEPEPEEIDTARKIFELKVKNNLGAKNIALWLNDREIKNRDKRWNKTVIGEYLRNEKLIGKTVFGRKDRHTKRVKPREQWIIVDSHKPIIPTEVWKRAQEQLNRDITSTESGSPHSTYLFTGLLKCGECGAAMQIESAKGRNKRYWYYNCRAAAVEKAHPPRRVPARELDDFLVREFADKIFSKKALSIFIKEMTRICGSWTTDRDKRKKQTQASLKEAKTKQSKIFDIMETYGSDTPNLGDLTIRLREHNQTRKKLEIELAAINTEQPPEWMSSDIHISDLRDTLVAIINTSINPKKIRNFFASFVDRVILKEKELRIEYHPQRIIQKPVVVVPSKNVWLPGPDLLGTKTISIDLPDRFMKAA